MPSTTAETPFVGRIDELAALTDALPAGRSPRARLWLVGGEPGIGKTRLVRELTRVAERHHSVSWGQCWHEAGTPPYWPWTQVIRRLQGVDSGTELASLVVANVDAETTAATDRFELFDATAAELRRASRRGPLVVVLDDLHRADPPTLQLTRFLLAHLTDVELLVVATYRPDEAENRDDIAVDLAALRAGAQTLSLSGLDADGVSAIVGDELLGEGVWALTGGNPLFVEQVLRAGAQRTAPSAEPDGRALGAVLRRRLDTLEPSALDLLAALAVLGPGASAEPVAALMELPADALTALVADLRGAGLVDRDELRLSHPLIAETAAECVAPERLARLHFAAATFGANNGAPAAERAHHLSRAGVDHWRDAVASRREAAAVAAASFAHDDAAAHLARAVELVEGHPEAIVTHFEVMLELAVARERTSGTLVAEDTYRRALELAQRTGDPRLIGRAAARHGIAFFADTRAQLDRAADCRAALAALPAGEEALRARLLANLAAADPAAADRSLYADEAVALARTIGDPEALGMALVAQQLVDLGPSTLASRFRSSREVIALAEWCGEPDLAVRGRFLLKNALLEAGDVRELDAELLAQDRTVTEIGEARFARHSLWFRCMRAMLDGRAVEAEDLAGQCLAIAQDLRDPDGFGVYTGQYGVALWLQGRLAELEPVYLDLMHDEPDEPLWPAVVGWIALSEGRLDTARGLLDRFPPPSQLPQGMHT
ncbi:MAG: AAA family ATPase, partial [Actinobacteria bacterium]|nr:AAA family ATPase [Actinomycetota bacterium]